MASISQFRFAVLRSFDSARKGNPVRGGILVGEGRFTSDGRDLARHSASDGEIGLPSVMAY